MPRRLTQEEVLKRIIEVHGDTYDLSLLQYKNSRTKVEIRCRKHGTWEAGVEQLFRKQGCRECYLEQKPEKQRKGFDYFIKRARESHGTKYNYTKQDYIDLGTKIQIKCPTHGAFSMLPSAHIGNAGLKPQGCPDCAVIKVADLKRMSVNEFIEKANKKHAYKYDYTSVKPFQNQNDFVEVICPTHGVWDCHVGNHISVGSGCPDCNNSRGENAIRLLLIKEGIEFIAQKSFKDLKHKGYLKCDFYLPKYNTVIEYNGRQHYEPVKAFGGVKALKETQERDEVKRKYLQENGISLIEIHYKNSKLKKTIFKHLNTN